MYKDKKGRMFGDKGVWAPIAKVTSILMKEEDLPIDSNKKTYLFEFVADCPCCGHRDQYSFSRLDKWGRIRCWECNSYMIPECIDPADVIIRWRLGDNFLDNIKVISDDEKK